MSNTLDVSKLSAAEKDALILELAAAVSQLEQLVGDLREEFARPKVGRRSSRLG